MTILKHSMTIFTVINNDTGLSWTGECLVIKTSQEKRPRGRPQKALEFEVVEGVPLSVEHQRIVDELARRRAYYLRRKAEKASVSATASATAQRPFRLDEVHSPQ